MRELLNELEHAGERAAKRRRELLGDIDAEYGVHSQVEEEIFYPAFRDAAAHREDRVLLVLALEQHRLVDQILADLRAEPPDSEQFTAHARILKQLLELHMNDEEKLMFPRAREALGIERLQELGQRLEERKHELMSRAS
jgi:iron-sulfur cluster repair protein YtfE (RIC family)